MSLSNPDDIIQVKRGSTIFVSEVTLTSDHYRFKVYLLGAAGLYTLVYTSAQFANPGTGDETFDVDATYLDNNYYRLVVYGYDVGELVETFEDEIYFHVFPDELETQNSLSGLDSTMFSKLLMMLGHNALDGEFNNAAGYTQDRVRRGLGTMTEAEADAFLAASDAPGDSSVLYKTKAVLTTSDEGNEQLLIEVEEDVT